MPLSSVVSSGINAARNTTISHSEVLGLGHQHYLLGATIQPITSAKPCSAPNASVSSPGAFPNFFPVDGTRQGSKQHPCADTALMGFTVLCTCNVRKHALLVDHEMLSNRSEHGKHGPRYSLPFTLLSPLLAHRLHKASPQGLFSHLATDSLLRRNTEVQQSLFGYNNN